jgi:hypothetical protein
MAALGGTAKMPLLGEGNDVAQLGERHSHFPLRCGLA